MDTLAALREWRRAVQGDVGVVPTMGALHEGHLALVRASLVQNTQTIVWIFVNPAQFAAHEDLSRYPRPIERDLALLEQVGANAVFLPTPDLVYPDGFQTWIEVGEVSQGLEGERRPGHFRGVATVVAKLFNMILPTRAYFGQKDAQQVVVIKQMVRDLNFPLRIIVCPTVREVSGLAMSSRNIYLTPEQHQAAHVLFRSMQRAADLYQRGERRQQVIKKVVEDSLAQERLGEVEYVQLVDAQTLHPSLDNVLRPVLLTLTVRFGATRLLDNCLLPIELNDMDGLTRILGGDTI